MASSPALAFLALRPRFFLGAPLAVKPLTWLPLTCDVASTEGERPAGDRPSGGKEVWRRGWVGALAWDGFLRFADPELMSMVEERFLLGS